MNHSSLQRVHKPHEQSKIERLLARLANLQPASSKPAPVPVGVRVIKTA